MFRGLMMTNAFVSAGLAFWFISKDNWVLTMVAFVAFSLSILAVMIREDA